MLTKYDYQFLVGWEGPRGACYNECMEFCKENGFFAGFHDGNRPIITTKGLEAIEDYQTTLHPRIDVV